MYRLGVVLAKENDLDGAAECFRQANKHPGPHSPASHNNLGVMLARMGRLSEAEAEFAEALRLANGRFENASYNLNLSHKLRLVTQNREQPHHFALTDR